MKSAFILIVLTTLAYAEVEIFANDQQINIEDKEILEMLQDIDSSLIEESSDDLDVTKGPFVVKKIKKALEKAREQLGVGFPDQGIPPLDPFNYNKFSFQLQHQSADFKADLDLTNITVTGLQKFVTDYVAYSLFTHNLFLNLDIPDLVYTSEFQIRGTKTGTPYNINGEVRFELKHFLAKIFANIQKTNGNHLKLNKFTLDLSVGNTMINLKDETGTGPIKDVEKWILGIFTNDVIKTKVEDLGRELTGQLFDMINKFLGQIEVTYPIG